MPGVGGWEALGLDEHGERSLPCFLCDAKEPRGGKRDAICPGAVGLIGPSQSPKGGYLGGHVPFLFSNT